MAALSVKSWGRLCLLAYAVLTLALAMAVHMFVVGHRARAARQVEEARQHLAELSAHRELWGQLEKAVAERKKTARTDAIVLPADRQAEAFLAAVNEGAARRGVQILSVETQPPARFGDMARASVKLSCRGPFAGLHGFLYGLEQGAVLAQVDGLKIRPFQENVCAMEVTWWVYAR